MALGTTGSFAEEQVSTQIPEIVRPAQLAAKWDYLISNGGLETADNGGSSITNPATQVTNSTTRIMKCAGRGTILRLRMRYDDGITTSTDPVVQVFGRFDDGEAWQKLVNKAATHEVSFPSTEAADAADGTDKYTDVDPDDHAWDLDGCNEILVGVKTALAASGGDPTLSLLEGKLI